MSLAWNNKGHKEVKVPANPVPCIAMFQLSHIDFPVSCEHLFCPASNRWYQIRQARLKATSVANFPQQHPASGLVSKGQIRTKRLGAHLEPTEEEGLSLPNVSLRREEAMTHHREVKAGPLPGNTP